MEVEEKCAAKTELVFVVCSVAFQADVASGIPTAVEMQKWTEQVQPKLSVSCPNYFLFA